MEPIIAKKKKACRCLEFLDTFRRQLGKQRIERKDNTALLVYTFWSGIGKHYSTMNVYQLSTQSLCNKFFTNHCVQQQL